MKKLKTWASFVDEENGGLIELQNDKKGNMYVNGKRILTGKVIKLRWFELILLFLTTTFVGLESVCSLLTYLNIKF